MRPYLAAGVRFYARSEVDQAIGCWRRAADITPQARTFFWLAQAYRKKGLAAEAKAACEKALALEPGQPAPYRMLARLAAPEELEGVGRRWLAALPGSVDARVLLADIEKRRGGVRAAYELLEPAVRGEDADVRAVSEFAQVCNRLAEPPAEAAGVLERWAARADVKPRERVKIVRGLARLYDALGRPDDAFARMREARELQSAEFGDDVQRFFDILAASRRSYTAERLAHLPRATHGSELPVFIVGMPRSGTTLAEQIIASHPRAHGAGELTHIIRFARVLGGSSLTLERVNALAADYLGRVRLLAPKALRIADKMPFNFLHLGLIELLFPRARVVHCVRDPLDTCISCFFNEFPDALAIAHDLGTLGRYYREYQGLMQHWRKVLRLPILDLRYEDMVAEPEAQIRRLVEFCGLEWDEACLRFHASRRRVTTSSYHQVTRPIYASSIGRHKAYARHLGPLRAALERPA